MVEAGRSRKGAGSRRGLLADAAIAVLARNGARGLTHRAVDREAAVPIGTAKNYFPTRDCLLAAAAQRMAEEHQDAVSHLRGATPPAVSVTQIGALYPALLYRTVYSDPAQMVAMAELYLEAVRRPSVRAALGEMALANAESAATLHRMAGLTTSVSDAGVLDAYLLGLSLSLLALPREVLSAIGLDNPHVLGRGAFEAVAGPAARR
ncbi:MAG: TetR family transcriptional regulator [Kutzneria sp.]|nr:TetR family transcriptional regulator [Kutzneria sp.]MBV9845992.1 TetR family transcriptional regulator [Kutzneria sp.]